MIDKIKLLLLALNIIQWLARKADQHDMADDIGTMVKHYNKRALDRADDAYHDELPPEHEDPDREN